MELLVAMTVSVIVLGGAVAITSQVQTGYRRQIEDAVAEQEARYALEWIGRYIRAAGNNSAGAAASGVCPSDPTPFAAIRLDPDADGVDDDIRIQSDVNPPDGLIGGNAATGCDQANEDVTISLDDQNDTIVFFDNNLGGDVSTRTDNVIEDLRFIYRDMDRNVTADPAQIVSVETRITVRSRTLDPSTGEPRTRVLSMEVSVRSAVS